MDRVTFLRSLGVAAVAASAGLNIEQAASDMNVDITEAGVSEEAADAIRKRLEELFVPGGVITAAAFREAFMMVLLGSPNTTTAWTRDA